MIKALALAFILGLVGCQMKPTKTSDEAGNRDAGRVLVDTRTSLQYESFHVAGSVHLRSDDYLVLQNARTKTRILDPDIEQIVERLARRGVSPQREIVLLSEKADSIENKKWNWLLLQLGVKNVVMMSLQTYREVNKGRPPLSPPEKAAVWSIERPQLLKAQAQQCFVAWSDEKCL